MKNQYKLVVMTYIQFLKYYDRPLFIDNIMLYYLSSFIPLIKDNSSHYIDFKIKCNTIFDLQ